jgi:hypothetical protein
MITFLAVLVGQVFFRASSTLDASRFLGALGGANGLGFDLHALPTHAYAVFLLLPVVWFFPNTQEILGQVDTVRANIFSGSRLAQWQPDLKWAGALGILMILVLWYMTNTSAFLYFQF